MRGASAGEGEGRDARGDRSGAQQSRAQASTAAQPTIHPFHSIRPRIHSDHQSSTSAITAHAQTNARVSMLNRATMTSRQRPDPPFPFPFGFFFCVGCRQRRTHPWFVRERRGARRRAEPAAAPSARPPSAPCCCAVRERRLEGRRGGDGDGGGGPMEWGWPGSRGSGVACFVGASRRISERASGSGRRQAGAERAGNSSDAMAVRLQLQCSAVVTSSADGWLVEG